MNLKNTLKAWKKFYVKNFCPPKKTCTDVNLVKKLKETESVCVTVRRGNFTDTQYKDKFLVCTTSFYVQAEDYIKRIYQDALFYICSDDIQWCKDELRLVTANFSVLSQIKFS